VSIHRWTAARNKPLHTEPQTARFLKWRVVRRDPVNDGVRDNGAHLSDNPYAISGFREAARPSLKWLCRFSLVALILNVVSLMMLDTREWLVDFDLRILLFAAFPVFAFAVPVATLFAAIDQPGADGRMTRFASSLLIASEAFWFLMIALGTFCRDAFLTFYWPWEARGMKIVAVNNLNLSEMFWQRTLASSLPDNPVLRELPGEILILAYCLATSISCWCICKPRRWRHAALCAVSQLALFFPFVILVKRVFSVKYLVTYPEIFFNV